MFFSAKEDTSELQGDIERLQRQVEEKDADIEKLKFDLLVVLAE